MRISGYWIPQISPKKKEIRGKAHKRRSGKDNPEGSQNWIGARSGSRSGSSLRSSSESSNGLKRNWPGRAVYPVLKSGGSSGMKPTQRLIRLRHSNQPLGSNSMSDSWNRRGAGLMPLIDQESCVDPRASCVSSQRISNRRTSPRRSSRTS